MNLILTMLKINLIYIDTIYNPIETKTFKFLKENKIKSFQWFRYVYLSRPKIFLFVE